MGGFHPTIGIEIGEFFVVVGSTLKEDKKYSRYIDFGDRDIAFNILKEIFLSNEMRNLNDLVEFKTDFRQRFDKFENNIKEYEVSFEQKKETVINLEKKLENYKTTYDFVLLNKGFKQLYDEKRVELKERRNSFSNFGATLAITPIAMIGFSFLLFLWKDEAAFKYLLYLAFPVTTFMLIILYFVKVSLQHVRSVQSQMMQLELRMALCQFIHNYAEDSEKLHKKNSAGFEKFENIIFSPLVSSDDKIPTTFDGMEQLAKLVSEFRKN